MFVELAESGPVEDAIVGASADGGDVVSGTESGPVVDTVLAGEEFPAAASVAAVIDEAKSRAARGLAETADEVVFAELAALLGKFCSPDNRSSNENPPDDAEPYFYFIEEFNCVK